MKKLKLPDKVWFLLGFGGASLLLRLGIAAQPYLQSGSIDAEYLGMRVGITLFGVALIAVLVTENLFHPFAWGIVLFNLAWLSPSLLTEPARVVRDSEPFSIFWILVLPSTVFVYVIEREKEKAQLARGL